jgi:hypothetical protein
MRCDDVKGRVLVAERKKKSLVRNHYGIYCEKIQKSFIHYFLVVSRLYGEICGLILKKTDFK